MHRLSLSIIGTGLVSIAFAFPSLAAAAQVNIAIGDNYFNPNNPTIQVGDTVTWTNLGSMPHTVKADSGAFGDVTLQPGRTFSFTFNIPGVFPYHCTLHGGSGGAGMSGRITVGGQSGTNLVSQSQAQAQVQALLQQVALLQQQIGTQARGGTVSTGGTAQGVSGLAQQAGVQVVDSSSCPQIGRTLKIGSTGDDVTRLQQFLARDPNIYPQGTVSGYYGALTEAAVKQWQAKFNIVSSGTPESTGFGVVGPRTAAAISLQCSLYAGGGTGGGGSVSPVGGYIQVSPISGNAPLTVNVQANVNTTKSCTGAAYTLLWGDNTGGAQIPVPAGNCNQLSQTFTHTYQYGGIYLMTLSALGHTTTATVTVYGASAPNPTGSPTPTPTPGQTAYGPFSVTPNASGDPLSVSASFDVPTACTKYELSWGDGTANATGQSTGTCASGTVQPTLVHNYAVPGTYSIVLKRGASLDKTDTATLSISN